MGNPPSLTSFNLFMIKLPILAAPALPMTSGMPFPGSVASQAGAVPAGRPAGGPQPSYLSLPAGRVAGPPTPSSGSSLPANVAIPGGAPVPAARNTILGNVTARATVRTYRTKRSSCRTLR